MVLIDATSPSPKPSSYTLLPATPNSMIIPKVLKTKGGSYTITIVTVLFFGLALTSHYSMLNYCKEHNTGVQATMKRINFRGSSSEKYLPSDVEKYVLDNSIALGYDKLDPNEAEGCKIFKSSSYSTEENYQNLRSYRQDIENYSKAIENFPFSTIVPVLMEEMRLNGDGNWQEICAALRPHPDGVQGLFPSQQLSLLPFVKGFVEPLLPPMRHPAFCDEVDAIDNVKVNIRALGREDYLVHDFEAMCMSLRPSSRIVLFDLGASLKRDGLPMVELMNLYKKFGFKFDHIYAFEVTPTDPVEIYKNLLPEEYLASYHWINVGMDTDFLFTYFYIIFLPRSFVDTESFSAFFISLTF